MEIKKIKDYKGIEHCFHNVTKEESIVNIDGEEIYMVWSDEGIAQVIISNKSNTNTRIDAWDGDESFKNFN